jgi:hypothetical protein
MKRVWISLIAAGLLTIAMIAPASAQIFSVPLDEVDESGVEGGASVRGVEGGVEIRIYITDGDTDGVHPVHIHEGRCNDLGDVAYPLEDIVDGESETTLDISLGDILTGEYAINAHLSEDEMGVNVMCGNLPAVEGLAPSDDDDEATDDEADDEAVEDDDAEAADDADDAVEEDDDAAEDDDSADDAEELVPAAGSVGGASTEAIVLMMTMAGGATLGAGLLVRRRFVKA